MRRLILVAAALLASADVRADELDSTCHDAARRVVLTMLLVVEESAVEFAAPRSDEELRQLLDKNAATLSRLGACQHILALPDGLLRAMVAASLAARQS